MASTLFWLNQSVNNMVWILSCVFYIDFVMQSKFESENERHSKMDKFLIFLYLDPHCEHVYHRVSFMNWATFNPMSMVIIFKVCRFFQTNLPVWHSIRMVRHLRLGVTSSHLLSTNYNEHQHLLHLVSRSHTVATWSRQLTVALTTACNSYGHKKLFSEYVKW